MEPDDPYELEDKFVEGSGDRFSARFDHYIAEKNALFHFDEFAGADQTGRVRRLLRPRDGARARDTGRAVLVAVRDGQIVGFVAGGVRLPDAGDELSAVPFRNGRITELYVDPSFRRQGLATALVEAMERHFSEVGCGAVRIEVFALNVGARAFYASHGYERDIDLLRPLAQVERDS